MKKIFLSLMVLFLVSCVNKSTYDEVVFQNSNLMEENNRLKSDNQALREINKKLKEEKNDLILNPSKVQEKRYEIAKRIDTSDAWKRFLRHYPNYFYKSDIERRIIQLEVNEIMGNSNTGKMPSFEKNYSSSFSSSSSNSMVNITNDTGCELTVRYSGKDVKKIVIPIGESINVSLKSGSYNITASACGSNYAGTEYLDGSYSSKFYIQRTYGRY